jgi:prepilin-type N-terminal cleavage/methylation domain-containing protein
MSASCPRSRTPAPRARGFTLLELLIVLALISMVAAMVAPRLQRTYDAVARSGNRAEAVRQVERLPLIARDRGRAIVVPADDPAALATLLSLPEGWQARAVGPIRIEANGLCHAAKIRMQGDGAAEVWELSAPDCSVADAP